MITRRNWARTALTGAVGAAAPQRVMGNQDNRPRVGCILNVYTPDSHADVFISRLLDGYGLNGQWHGPRLRAANFYVDQFPASDMARDQAEAYGIRLCSSVAEAIDGVDAVCVIGEHGDYGRTPRGNFRYPRKRYFDQITGSFQSRGKVKPLLNDKYFAYEWSDAKAMADRVRELRIPFACGSTVPLSWQRPALRLPAAPKFRELLAVSYSDLEEHSYHAIEGLQFVAERRGETGVARVRYLEGDPVWKINPPLLDAALARRVNAPPEDKGQKPEAFEWEYRDGVKASVLNLNSRSRDYLVAADLADSGVQATCFYLSLYAHTHWGFMVQAFENLVLTGKEQTPLERTLLANGIMLAGLESRRQGGTWIDTPELGLSYSWPRR